MRAKTTLLLLSLVLWSSCTNKRYEEALEYSGELLTYAEEQEIVLDKIKAQIQKVQSEFRNDFTVHHETFIAAEKKIVEAQNELQRLEMKLKKHPLIYGDSLLKVETMALINFKRQVVIPEYWVHFKGQERLFKDIPLKDWSSEDLIKLNEKLSELTSGILKVHEGYLSKFIKYVRFTNEWEDKYK